jgi:hypothetical protein
MFLITMVLSSQAAHESLRMRLSAGQAERQCVYAMNRKKTNRRYRAPIFDDTAPQFIVKDTNRVLCPYSHELGAPFVTDKKTKCSECCVFKKLPAGTSMHNCPVCKKKGFGKVYCTGCTHAMDGTYRKLAGGLNVNKHQAGQTEGTYAVNHSLSEAPFRFGNEKDVLNICGDHVWRNEESGLLMMRSPIVNRTNWSWNRKNDYFYPCFQSHAWIIVKWPCQYPPIAQSTGAKEVDYQVKYKGFRAGKTFESFCGLPEELEMDFADRGANTHLPPTNQRWELEGDKTFTIERHIMMKRQCSGGMPGNHLQLVKED